MVCNFCGVLRNRKIVAVENTAKDCLAKNGLVRHAPLQVNHVSVTYAEYVCERRSNYVKPKNPRFVDQLPLAAEGLLARSRLKLSHISFSFSGREGLLTLQQDSCGRPSLPTSCL